MSTDYYGWLRAPRPSVDWIARPMATPQRTVEQDMHDEIVRLRTEIATLKATLGMVRAVLAQTVENITLRPVA